ncbi:17397_t:CDS:2, partial [Gigaspora rosea]
MYICITSNGPIENLYTRLQKNNSSIDIDAFIRRVKFIIKYKEESIDENGKDLGIEGEIYQDVKTGLFYWRQSWDNIINKYSIIENIDNKTDR